MNTLQVIQITDIHLLADDSRLLYGVDTTASLNKVLNKIASLPIDLIVVSGDLAEGGDPTTYQKMALIFKPLNIPVFFLPGNHDKPSAMAEYLNDGNLHCCFDMQMSGWGFIFLSSQVEGRSFGNIGDAQLAKLDQYLTDNPKNPVFIAQHHPSFTICPTAGCQLEDATALQQLLAKHSQVKVLVAGHTHNDQQDLSLPYAQYVTPSSFAFATHNQDLTCHKSDDFWAAHKLDSTKIGCRRLALYADGKVESDIIWA